jgi:hypothetical protein
MKIPKKGELTMPNEGIQELVVEQALASEVNLRVACAVHQSFDAILKAVISKFLRQLATEVSVSLGSEWKISVEAPNSSRGEHLVFTVGKTNWIKLRPIVLGIYSYPSKAFIGIQRKEPTSAFSETSDEDLCASLKSIIPSLKTRDQEWVAWWDVRHNTYGAWNSENPKVLCEMYYDTPQVVSYFKEAIERCARTVEPVMDRYCP